MLYVKTSLLRSYLPTNGILLSVQRITSLASPTARPPASIFSMPQSAGSFPNALTSFLQPPISLTKRTTATPPSAPFQNFSIPSTYDQEMSSSKCKSNYNYENENMSVFQHSFHFYPYSISFHNIPMVDFFSTTILILAVY